MKPRVIGIILTFNCAKMLERAFHAIPRALFDEIILVDDGSTDGTMGVARRLDVIAFTHEHRGYGGNIKFGLQKAVEMGGDYMVEIHGDGQYDSSLAGQGLEKIQQGYDLLLGSRFTDLRQPRRDGMPLARYLANIGLSAIARFVLRIPLTEFHSGFRIYSRRLVERVGFSGTSDDYLYSFEVIAQARYYDLTITEVPMRCTYTEEHTSINLRKSVAYALETFWVLLKYVAARWGWKNRLFREASIVR